MLVLMCHRHKLLVELLWLLCSRYKVCRRYTIGLSARRVFNWERRSLGAIVPITNYFVVSLYSFDLFYAK
jgi:hypothetical protein